MSNRESATQKLPSTGALTAIIITHLELPELPLPDHRVRVRAGPSDHRRRHQPVPFESSSIAIPHDHQPAISGLNAILI